MADKQLENLAIISDDFNNFAKGVQRTYYNNGQVEITATGITPDKPINQVWRSRIIPRKFKRVPVIASIQKFEDNFYIEYARRQRSVSSYFTSSTLLTTITIMARIVN